jgi:Family of unknown function (DUF6152)
LDDDVTEEVGREEVVTWRHAGRAQRSLTLLGTVMLFQWTNPYCWIQVLATTPTPETEWSVDGIAGTAVSQRLDANNPFAMLST